MTGVYLNFTVSFLNQAACKCAGMIMKHGKVHGYQGSREEVAVQLTEITIDYNRDTQLLINIL